MSWRNLNDKPLDLPLGHLLELVSDQPVVIGRLKAREGVGDKLKKSLPGLFPLK